MKFTGQIRVPEIDHPGVPATFLVEGVQAEVILEGDESLGRWSLFDVHARRLVASAFQVDLDGEEITFVADEPIDFAYRGVERMAEVWAKYKSMNVARRAVAVARSRKGTVPSKIGELRTAMEQNLETQTKGHLAGSITSSVLDSGYTPESVAREIESLREVDDPHASESADEAVIPMVEEPSTTSEPDVSEPAVSEPDVSEPAVSVPAVAGPDVSGPAVAGPDASDRAESDALAAERRAIEEERAKLEEQRKLLEAKQVEAEQRESDRVEAFRIEMKRLEAERGEFEQREQERQASMKRAMERLEAERGELARKSAEHQQREGVEVERVKAFEEQMKKLEEEQRRREREEAERVEAARKEMEELEERKRALEGFEREKAEAERRAATEAERRAATEAERRAATEAERQAAAEASQTSGEEPADGQEEVDDDVSSADESTVLDLGEFEEGSEESPQPPGTVEDSEPALTGAGEGKQGGIMGAVRSAFGRGGREHAHDFVEAPGGIGIARSICQECGYVSISTGD